MPVEKFNEGQDPQLKFNLSDVSKPIVGWAIHIHKTVQLVGQRVVGRHFTLGKPQINYLPSPGGAKGPKVPKHIPLQLMGSIDGKVVAHIIQGHIVILLRKLVTFPSPNGRKWPIHLREGLRKPIRHQGIPMQPSVGSLPPHFVKWYVASHQKLSPIIQDVSIRIEGII